jgi:hypothetical protein
MIKTLVIPLSAGFLCFLVTAVILHLVMPLVDLDNTIKGLITVVGWLFAFTIPAEYLRKKAKEKLIIEKSKNI